MQSRVKRVIFATGIIFILMLLLCVIMTNLFHYNYKMNSDIGAEAVLGRLIWDSKEIIPASWYPSTETRIIATPQVAALFYGLTGNMDLSMGLACCTMTIGIVLAIWFFMKKAGSSRISCLLMCLYSAGFAGNIIILELLYVFAGYYAIHVIAFSFILNCYSSLLQEEWKKSKSLRRKMYGKCIIGLILAFLLGMQGTRGILITFGPLFGIEMIRIMYERICRNRYLKKRDHSGQASGENTISVDKRITGTQLSWNQNAFFLRSGNIKKYPEWFLKADSGGSARYMESGWIH